MTGETESRHKLSVFWTQITGIPARAELTLSQSTFTKVYPQGWAALAGLVGNPTARVYVFLADNCGHDNALVATYETIAEALGLHERTIRRAIRELEAGQHLLVGKVGTANCYVLNCDEIWKTYEEHKTFCSFRTKTLVSKRRNADFTRRLTHKLAQRELNLV